MNKLKHHVKKHILILKENEKKIISKSIDFSNILHKAILNKKKILVAGNGGSASDAQHIAAELIVRLNKKRIALPCISLSADSSVITAASNDINFDKVFSRQVEAIGLNDDVLIVLSTSGNSANIIEALKAANKKKLFSIGIFGNNGGKAKRLCDDFFAINEKNPGRIQEIHIIFYHLFCELLEGKFKGKLLKR